MIARRAAVVGAATLVGLACSIAPAVAAPSTGDGCSFARGTTTCVTTESHVQTYSAPAGVDITKITVPSAWGSACLAFVPTTTLYGAFDGAVLQETVMTTTTSTYRGREARHDKKISSSTDSATTYRVTHGSIYCYSQGKPIVFDAPYPS
ncbi:MAG: hypothetical protein ABJA89_09330 [Lapillicoccus sp.]